MPPKRRWVWVGNDDNADEPPQKKRAAVGSKRGKSTTPNWNERPEWSQVKPTGQWGKRCVERWCLLAPYDTTITEIQWKAYYDERSALDRINTLRSEESAAVISEELDQNTWEILRKSAEDVAAAILGSQLDDEERKKRIAHTLIGSLYFIELWGRDEGAGTPSPRNVDARTRLYSPFGIGTSVDFHYDYYFRFRLHSESERSSSLGKLTSLSGHVHYSHVDSASSDAVTRTINDCQAKNPAVDPDSEDSEDEGLSGYTIFSGVEDLLNGFVTEYITEVNIKSFEEPLFGAVGWLSPRKLADLFLAAGTVMHYREADTETAVNLLERFHYFQGENVGKRPAVQERKLLTRLEKQYISEHPGDDVCIPQRQLLLARQGGASGST